MLPRLCKIGVAVEVGEALPTPSTYFSGTLGPSKTLGEERRKAN